MGHPFWISEETQKLGRASASQNASFSPWRLELLIETRKLLKADPANETLFSLLLRNGE